METTIVVIGSSISGNLAAGYLKKQFPDWNVNVIGDFSDKSPVVGESLTEFSTYLLHEVGLGQCLEEKHFHKYGLTFYFKESIDNPACRTYAVHEAPCIPPMPSNQINRFEIDRELKRLNGQRGVVHHKGKVSDVTFSNQARGGTHIVEYKNMEGRMHQVPAQWVIDASGRSRFLAKKLGLKSQAPYQRSSFWFRLVDFDRDRLAEIRAVKPEQQCYDSYYVTHHFMGHGNWVWCIPMNTTEHSNMMSIGIVWRPDIFEGEVRSIDDFLEKVGQEHPVLCDLIRSGKVHDTNLYRNYLYESSQVYSDNGWFLIGDAGDSVDPLYSTGLVMTSIQITQIASILGKHQEGSISSRYTADLEAAYKAVRNALQTEISTMYEIMHDPYQCQWRMHFSSMVYFFLMLPSWLSGYMSHPVGARWIKKATEGGIENMKELVTLLPQGSMRLRGISAEQLPNRYFETVNWELWKGEEHKLPYYMSKLFFRFAKFRLELLKNAGWTQWGLHIRRAASDLFSSIVMRVFLKNAIITETRMVKKMLQEEDMMSPANHGQLATNDSKDVMNA